MGTERAGETIEISLFRVLILAKIEKEYRESPIKAEGKDLVRGGK